MFTKSLERCYNIARLRERAAKRMPAAMFHYIDGAAGDEWTMRQNTEAFDQYELHSMAPAMLLPIASLGVIGGALTGRGKLTKEAPPNNG